MNPKSQWQWGGGQVGSGSFSTFALAHWLRSVAPLLHTMQGFATNTHNNTPLSHLHTDTHRVNNTDAPRWEQVIAACALLSNPLSNCGVICVTRPPLSGPFCPSLCHHHLRSTPQPSLLCNCVSTLSFPARSSLMTNLHSKHMPRQ